MRAKRRGGVYIAVLGVTLFVTVIGLSAMLLVESERETRIAVSESRQARTDARSAMEIALSRIAEDSAWRASNPSGTWAEAKTLGGAKWGYVLEYEEATPADEAVEVSLTVGARRNDTARFYSVDALVSPSAGSAGPNLCANSGFEGTYAPWFPFVCIMVIDSSNPHSGASALAISGRLISSTGPMIELKDKVSDNTEYEVSMWIRAAAGATETVRVSLTSTVGFAATEDTFDATGVDENWTKIRGSLVADWEDGQTPDSVTIRVNTVGTTTGFWVDDVEIRQALPSGAPTPVTIVSGSYRQRVIE